MKTKSARTENGSHWPVEKRIVDPYEVSRGSSNYQSTKCVDYALWVDRRRTKHETSEYNAVSTISSMGKRCREGSTRSVIEERAAITGLRYNWSSAYVRSISSTKCYFPRNWNSDSLTRLVRSMYREDFAWYNDWDYIGLATEWRRILTIPSNDKTNDNLFFSFFEREAIWSVT